MFSVVAHNKHGVKFTSSSISVYAFFALLVSSFTSSRSFYPLLLERILHRRYIYYTHNSLNGIQNIHDHHRRTKVSKKKKKRKKKKKKRKSAPVPPSPTKTSLNVGTSPAFPVAAMMI